MLPAVQFSGLTDPVSSLEGSGTPSGRSGRDLLPGDRSWDLYQGLDSGTSMGT